jgi:Ca-activated chloride channel homolog
MTYKFIIYHSSFIILFLGPSVFFAQTAHKMLRKGDAEYLSKDYKAAEENYRKANETERTQKGSFNLGNTIYLQQRYDEAIKQYEDAAGRAKTNDLKANALYNKGNAYLWKKDAANAEKAYKEALLLNPNDVDAKRNLALTKKLKKQQEQEEKNQKNKDPNKDKNKKDDKQNDKKDPKDDKQNQDKNNPENKDEKGKDQQQKDQNQQIDQNAQNNRPQNTPMQDLKKEDAKRMLQIMDDEERKVQQRLKKGKAKPSKSDKDW